MTFLCRVAGDSLWIQVYWEEQVETRDIYHGSSQASPHPEKAQGLTQCLGSGKSGDPCLNWGLLQISRRSLKLSWPSTSPQTHNIMYKKCCALFLLYWKVKRHRGSVGLELIVFLSLQKFAQWRIYCMLWSVHTLVIKSINNFEIPRLLQDHIKVQLRKYYLISYS